MSAGLVYPEAEVELDSQDIEKERTIKEIEQENECPRCYDVMALSSYFEESRILRWLHCLKI
jgi:hypothetical protein